MEVQVTATCQAVTGGSNCTPENAFSGSSATIVVSISDLAGNTNSATTNVILDTDGDGESVLGEAY